MLVLPFSDIAVEIVEDSPFATSDNLFNEEKIFIKTSFPQLFYPLMTRQFFCDFHEKSEDFCVS